MGFSSYLKSTVFSLLAKDDADDLTDNDMIEKASYLMDGHLKNNKEIVTIFAVGIAAANADGVIVPKEKEAIYNIAKNIRPTHPQIAQCVKKMLRNPSSDLDSILLDAFTFMSEKEVSDWSGFKSKLAHLIEDVVKADGVITEEEKQFIFQFEAYFLVKININIDKSS